MLAEKARGPSFIQTIPSEEVAAAVCHALSVEFGIEIPISALKSKHRGVQDIGGSIAGNDRLQAGFPVNGA